MGHLQAVGLDCCLKAELGENDGEQLANRRHCGENSLLAKREEPAGGVLPAIAV